MPNYDDACVSKMTCSASVCPLDPDIMDRDHIQGDKVCKHILTYWEGKETPFDDAIRDSKEVWVQKLGEGNLNRRIVSRNKLREKDKSGWRK